MVVESDGIPHLFFVVYGGDVVLRRGGFVVRGGGVVVRGGGGVVLRGGVIVRGGGVVLRGGGVGVVFEDDILLLVLPSGDSPELEGDL